MGSVTIYRQPVMSFANAELDPIQHTLICNHQSEYLRNKLWLVLERLIQNPDKLISRHQLIDEVWHANYYTGQAGLTHTICHLRKLFETLGVEAEITTVPKTGYVLRIRQSKPFNFGSIAPTRLHSQVK